VITSTASQVAPLELINANPVTTRAGQRLPRADKLAPRVLVKDASCCATTCPQRQPPLPELVHRAHWCCANCNLESKDEFRPWRSFATGVNARRLTKIDVEQMREDNETPQPAPKRSVAIDERKPPGRQHEEHRSILVIASRSVQSPRLRGGK
jgi:hypothetical protein